MESLSLFSDARLLDEIKKFTRNKKIKLGDVLFSRGEKVVFVPIVVKGVLRIIRQGTDDKEIFLYHLYPGQTCALAINCCQAGKISPVKAIALVDAWFRFPEWKNFINSTYAQRFGELIDVVDLVAFNNMDKQVLHYLQERSRATKSKVISITHQQIADELHTHREAVSRLLRAMEQKQIVRLSRNSIELL